MTSTAAGLATGAITDSSRTRLLRAATTLFAERGYAATSVREIVAAAGVTKPTLYDHFGSKEALYRDLLDGLFAEFESIVADSPDPDLDARETLRTICREIFSFVRQHVAAVRLFYAVHYGPPQGAPAVDVQRFIVRFREVTGDLVRRSAAPAKLRPEALCTAVTAIEAVMSISMQLLLIEPERHFSPRDLDHLLDIVMDGIASVRTSNSRQENH